MSVPPRPEVVEAIRKAHRSTLYLRSLQATRSTLQTLFYSACHGATEMHYLRSEMVRLANCEPTAPEDAYELEERRVDLWEQITAETSAAADAANAFVLLVQRSLLRLGTGAGVDVRNVGDSETSLNGVPFTSVFWALSNYARHESTSSPGSLQKEAKVLCAAGIEPHPTPALEFLLQVADPHPSYRALESRLERIGHQVHEIVIRRDMPDANDAEIVDAESQIAGEEAAMRASWLGRV